MVRKILLLDFVMSKWFAGRKKQEKVIPGTVFFFLSKIVYLGAIVVVFILKLIGITQPIFIVGGFVTYGLMIMLIVQPPVEQMVKDPLFEKEYKSLSKSQIYKKRALSLFIFIVSLYLMIVAVIIIGREEFL